jgi:hypothetical protein
VDSKKTDVINKGEFATWLFRRAVLVMMSVMFCGFGLFAHADPDPDPDPATVDKVVRPDHLGAVGIGVSALARSTRFYEEILGLSVLRVYEFDFINENVLGFFQQTHGLDSETRSSSCPYTAGQTVCYHTRRKGHPGQLKSQFNAAPTGSLFRVRH